MATARAIANGNWSSTSTWNGNALPGNGDTVYANGFNVTINQDINIGGANNPTVNAGSFVAGQWYEIVNVGGQTWTTIGAASNTVGTVFQSTGTGTAGNLGTAKALATLTTATNTAAGATTGGGGFTMSTIRAMTADLRAGTTTCLNVTVAGLELSGVKIFSGSAASSHGINYASTGTITFNGGCVITGSSNSASAINNSLNGTINISACSLFGGGAGNNFTCNAINNAAAGTVTITDSTIVGGAGASCATVVNASATGTINIISTTITGGANASAFAVVNSSTGNLNLSYSTILANASSGAINNVSTGTLIITNSTFTASAFANAVTIGNSAADVRLSGDFLDHWSGWKAVSGGKWRLGTAPTLGQTRYALAGTTDSYFTEYGADNGAFGNPIAANVRSGVSYGGGNLTGSCAVPAAGSVALGVAVDNTTGTATLTAANVRAALGLASANLDTQLAVLSNLDTTVSSRLAPSGTLATVTTLTNAPTVPTAAAIASQVRTELATELARVDVATSSRLATSAYTAPTAAPTVAAIRQEMDTNSTKLANLDATVSSRLASSAYSAAPTTAQIAAAVEGSLLNEGDGQAVLNAIVGAIGNTNLSEVSLVAAVRADLERNGGKLDSIPTTAAPTAAANATAVWATASKTITGGTVDTLTNAPSVPSAASIASATRTELAVELARVDAAVSSRLAGSAYTAPSNSDVAAIKAKTDALNTDRLANVATTAIVGNLIAQANS